MAEDRTPSDIEIDEDSGVRYDSHESLGYKRRSANSYSLARSPTPPEPSDIPNNTVDDANVGDTSVAYLSELPTELEQHLGGDATKVLVGAAAQEQLGSQQTALTTLPPPNVSHRHYSEHVSHIRDPKLAYTQVLLWCLQRRIDRLQRNPPKDLTTSRHLELLRVFKRFQRQLADEVIEPRWQSHMLLNLRPRMANPENVKSAEILKDLRNYEIKLKSDKNSTGKLLRNAERAESVGAARAETEADQSINQYEPVLEHAYSEPKKLLKEVFLTLAQIDALNGQSSALALEELDTHPQQLSNRTDTQAIIKQEETPHS